MPGFLSTGYSFAGRYSGELSVAQLKSTARPFRQDKNAAAGCSATSVSGGQITG